MAATKKAISKARYNEIKKYLHAPADDAGVMKKFGISQTTTRDIRNTRDYAEYCERRFRYHGYPKRFNSNTKVKVPMDVPILDSSGDKMPTIIPIIAPAKPKKDDTDILTKVIGVFLVLCLCAAVAALTYKLLCWSFGL